MYLYGCIAEFSPSLPLVSPSRKHFTVRLTSSLFHSPPIPPAASPRPGLSNQAQETLSLPSNRQNMQYYSFKDLSPPNNHRKKNITALKSALLDAPPQRIGALRIVSLLK